MERALSFHEAKASSDGEKKPDFVLFLNVNADRNTEQDSASFPARNVSKNSLDEVLTGNRILWYALVQSEALGSLLPSPGLFGKAW